MLQSSRRRQQPGKFEIFKIHREFLYKQFSKYCRTSTLKFVIVLSYILTTISHANAGVFYPRGASFGYLAAVAIPLDLPNRNVYMAFNFESNYGLPSNDSYNEWIDRWDLDNNFLSLGNNVTSINGRKLLKEDEKEGEKTKEQHKRKKRYLRPPFDRSSFYHTFTGYLDYYQMNGTGCLLRTICEVSASSMEENNGVLGSILKILFLPTTSRPETPLHMDMNDQELYRAEWQGRQNWSNNMKFENTNDGKDDAMKAAANNDDDNNNDNNMQANDNELISACLDYSHWCPEGVINMISAWY